MKYLVTGKIIQRFSMRVNAAGKNAAIAFTDNLSVSSLCAAAKTEDPFVAELNAKVMPKEAIRPKAGKK